MSRHLAALGLVIGCAPGSDLEWDRADLLRLHEVARRAHLDKRADLMVAALTTASARWLAAR